MIFYYIAGLINAYAFFTYIGDLNATQCVCAVNKQPNLNVVMRAYRWIIILGSVGALMQLLGLLGIGGSKIATSR
jgi:ABC-type spermidine/putrescine transport system permease subunit I